MEKYLTIERVLSIGALLFIAISAWLIYRKGRRDAELIFEADYYNLNYFIHHCEISLENEVKISNQLYHLSTMKGANKEKLQVLNAEFRRRFSASLGDIVADHENY